MTLARWAIYTVFLALIPVLIRLLILVLATPPARWFSEGDVITFGLILVITNISALESGTQLEANWKTKQMGLSLLLIATFATLFAITCFQELQPGLFRRDRLLAACLVLSLVSVLYSYSIWNRVAATQIASRGPNNE